MPRSPLSPCMKLEEKYSPLKVVRLYKDMSLHIIPPLFCRCIVAGTDKKFTELGVHAAVIHYAYSALFIIPEGKFSFWFPNQKPALFLWNHFLLPHRHREPHNYYNGSVYTHCYKFRDRICGPKALVQESELKLTP